MSSALTTKPPLPTTRLATAERAGEGLGAIDGSLSVSHDGKALRTSQKETMSDGSMCTLQQTIYWL